MRPFATAAGPWHVSRNTLVSWTLFTRQRLSQPGLVRTLWTKPAAFAGAASAKSYTLQHITNGTGLRTAIGYDLPHRPRYFDGFAAQDELFRGTSETGGGQASPASDAG